MEAELDFSVPVCDGANYPGAIKHGLLENPTFIDDITLW